jgi:hypothetical protein
LFVDGESKSALKIVSDYDLKDLLYHSWKNPRHSVLEDFNLSKEEIIEIATEHVIEDSSGPMHQSRKRSYTRSVQWYIESNDDESKKISLDNLKTKIQSDYIIDPKRFTRKGRSIIENSKANDVDTRWSNFNDVIDRLNSPELLDYYIYKNMLYIYDHQICQTPLQTFRRGKGCCVCIAKFGKRALEKAGYNTRIRHIVGNQDQHGVLVVKQEKIYYIVVDFIAGSINTVSGPFRRMSEVDKQIVRITGPVIISKSYLYN